MGIGSGGLKHKAAIVPKMNTNGSDKKTRPYKNIILSKDAIVFGGGGGLGTAKGEKTANNRAIDEQLQ